MSFISIQSRVIRSGVKVWAACAAVVAGLGAATTVNATAFTEGVWAPTSGKTLPFRVTGSGGESVAIFGSTGSQTIEVTSPGSGATMYSTYPNGGIFSGTANLTVPANQSVATAQFTAMNTTSTPWMSFTYIDRKNSNGSWPQFMMYLNADDSTALGNTNKNQVVAGSGYPVEVSDWFTENNTNITVAPWSGQYHGFGLEPVTTNTDNGLYGDLHHDYGNGTPNFATTGGNETATSATAADLGITNRVARIDGSTVTVKVGRLANGKIEFTYTVNGTTYPTWSNSWFNNSGFGSAFAINHVDLGMRQFSGTATFLDYNYGSDYTTQIPEPASLGLLGMGGVFMMVRRRKQS